MKRSAPLLLGLALALGGCNPFEMMTTEVDQRVPDERAGEIQLLSSKHRLPASASNVRLYFLQFQDPLLRIRFEAPRANAVKFAETYVGKSLQDGCGSFQFAADHPDWWIAACPTGAVHAQQFFSVDPPARYVLIVPGADRATVWLHSAQD